MAARSSPIGIGIGNGNGVASLDEARLGAIA